MLDLQYGYFDRLLLTPVRRVAILIGHMVADVANAAGLTVPILILSYAIGVRLDRARPPSPSAPSGRVSMSLCFAALRAAPAVAGAS